MRSSTRYSCVLLFGSLFPLLMSPRFATVYPGFGAISSCWSVAPRYLYLSMSSDPSRETDLILKIVVIAAVLCRPGSKAI
jgi:hypothetical protein